MPSKEKTIIVSHTHWDREWYLPFNLMRFRLVAAIDLLLDLLEKRNDFHSFMLDGQTSIIDDYLEIRPNNKEKFYSLIKKGKIIIGPFYVQNSPWLQTGEGYIRNLLIGHLKCEELNVRPMKVAYIPDQFVHFEQMPQIFKQFGIKAIAFSRGMGNQQEENDLKFEFEWQGPDKSSVLAVHLQGSYGQCVGLPDDPEMAINSILFSKGDINRFKKSTRWSLLFSGSDHRIPEAVLPDAIKLWNEIEEIVEDEGTIAHGTLEEYVDNVLAEKPDLSIYSGEIRGHRYTVSFQGVFSSCIPWKQKNFHAHDMLERYSEPLAQISRVIAHSDYEGFLKVAWRWLMKNQPHDSAWTASWDPVLKEMLTRYDWAIQNAEETRNWAFLDIMTRIRVEKQTDKQVEIVIFNPLEQDRKEPVILTVPVNFDLEDGYILVDSTGAILKSFYIKKEMTTDEIFLVRKFVGSQGPIPKNFYELYVEPVTVPAIGYTTLLLIPKEKDKQTLENQKWEDGNDQEIRPTLDIGETFAENDVIRLEINHDGSLRIKDKISGHVFENLNYYEDTADIGDGYEFISLPGDGPITTRICKAKISKKVKTDFLVSFEIITELEIPTGVNDNFSWRLEQVIKTPIITTVTIHAGASPRVDINVRFTNKCKDHRLNVVFPTGMRSKKIDVDGHFGITERKIKLPDGSKWAVKPVPEGPQHRFINITDYTEEKGIIIANRGLPEYFAYATEDESINLGLTLLRANSRWGVHINKNTKVRLQVSQILQDLSYDYSIIVHQGKIFDKGLKDALMFRYPLHAEYRGEYNKYQGYFPNIKKPESFLALSQSFFRLTPYPLVLSCIKKAERSDDIILRIYNMSKNEACSGLLETSLDIVGVDVVNLNEELLDEGNSQVKKESIHAIKINVPPAKIITLKLKLNPVGNK
ncbi:MAG: glycosyl hydrolase-related protein [Promethearchaeota archaeon]